MISEYYGNYGKDELKKKIKEIRGILKAGVEM